MKKHLFVWLLFSGSFLAQGQTLDLETCLKMADTANYSIKNSRLDILINDRQKDAYMSARMPKLNFAGDYKYNALIPGQVVPAEFFGGAPGTFATVQFGVPFNLSNTLQLTQVLYNPQINYGLAALDVNQSIVESQQKIVEQDSKYQVANTFFNLQAVNKQLEFLNSNIANMDRLIGNMQAIADNKLIVQTEVDKLKVNQLNLVNARESLTANKVQLESLLKILIGMNKDATINLASDELVENTILVDQSTITYPELELLEAQKRMNQEERKGTKMAYLPSLSFYAAYNYNYNMKPEDDFRTGIEAAFLGLKLDWTLFDGMEKFHKQKVNALNAEKLENQTILAAQQLELRTDNAKRMVDVQTNSLALSKEQLKLAENIYKQSENKYREGLIASNELITDENSLQQAQTNVIAAYIKLRQAELEYLKSIGNIK